MIWGNTFKKMKQLSNKEATIINEKDEEKIFNKKGLTKNIFLILASKSKVFGIMEIQIEKLKNKKYYLVRDDINGTLILVRDDKGELEDIIRDTVDKIRERLEEKYQTQIEFVDIDEDNLIFTDLRRDYENEAFDEVYSSVEVEDDVFATKTYRGQESGKLYIFVNAEDIAPFISTRIKETYEFSRSKALKRWTSFLS